MPPDAKSKDAALSEAINWDWQKRPDSLRFFNGIIPMDLFLRERQQKINGTLVLFRLHSFSKGWQQIELLRRQSPGYLFRKFSIILVRPLALLLVLLTTPSICWHNHQHEGRRVIPKQDHSRREQVRGSCHLASSPAFAWI
jgi:hypothetical protein